MTGTHHLGLSPRVWLAAVVAGTALGVIYVLSPLTVWFTLAMVVVVRWAVSDLAVAERRWVLALLVVAIVLRVAVVGGLFATTNHSAVPFGSLFGDEEYFIKRALWLRNVALGIPIHSADLIYAFDDYSRTSYLYVLAFLQVLVGPAPYGLHLLNAAFYLAASVLLFRLVRPSFGRTPAFLGLALIVFLPSLFAWSISALKEPLFFLLTASVLVLANRVVHVASWRRRLLITAAAVVLIAGLETIRFGAAALAIASVSGGYVVAALVRRPRLLLASVMVMPIALGALGSRPGVQVKVYAAIQGAARQHWGHVATAGYVYRALDERFYPDKSEIDDIHFDEMLRFVFRSVERYVTVPLPWEIQSRAALAYMPEQIVWYGLVLLAPLGFVSGVRRDPVLAGLLFAHAAVAAATVALTSGNVGTLVRHRGLALPYLIWLSAVGACEFLSAAKRHSAALTFTRAEPTWQ